MRMSFPSVLSSGASSHDAIALAAPRQFVSSIKSCETPSTMTASVPYRRAMLRSTAGVHVGSFAPPTTSTRPEKPRGGGATGAKSVRRSDHVP